MNKTDLIQLYNVEEVMCSVRTNGMFRPDVCHNAWNTIFVAVIMRVQHLIEDDTRKRIGILSKRN